MMISDGFDIVWGRADARAFEMSFEYYDIDTRRARVKCRARDIDILKLSTASFDIESILRYA